jgi:head-tail adaptor
MGAAVQVGRHNCRVTLWKGPTESNDADGFLEALSPPSWWCAIQPLPPQGDGRTITSLVSGRYHPQVTVDTIIKYGTRELAVRGVQNVDERNRELRLLCDEVQP